MTFELPEPAHKVGDYVMDCDYWQNLYTADQMQATYDAGRAAALEDAVKVCGDFDIPDIVEGDHPDYVEGKRMAVAQIAYKIGTLYRACMETVAAMALNQRMFKDNKTFIADKLEKHKDMNSLRWDDQIKELRK